MAAARVHQSSRKTQPLNSAADPSIVSYRGVRVRVGAIFDVRALLMPPLAAERIVRVSTRMGFRAEMLA